jgi:transposase
MRGADHLQESLFTVRQLDDFVPAAHPLRPIRDRVNQALVRLDGLFSRMYAEDARGGRPSIAPGKLLRAMLLQVFYSIRSERQLMEQIQYNMLFRWFMGLAMDDAVWVPTVFSKNRERLIAHDVIVALGDKAFFVKIMVATSLMFVSALLAFLAQFSLVQRVRQTHALLRHGDNAPHPQEKARKMENLYEGLALWLLSISMGIAVYALFAAGVPT